MAHFGAGIARRRTSRTLLNRPVGTLIRTSVWRFWAQKRQRVSRPARWQTRIRRPEILAPSASASPPKSSGFPTQARVGIRFAALPPVPHIQDPVFGKRGHQQRDCRREVPHSRATPAGSTSSASTSRLAAVAGKKTVPASAILAGFRFHRCEGPFIIRPHVEADRNR